MIVALDFETSGLDANKFAPVQIGLAVMEGESVVATYEAIFAEFPKRDYSIRALKITGITWRQIQEGKPIGDIFKEVEAFVAEHDAAELPIVSHNASFDQQFWDLLALECGAWIGKWPNKKFVKEKELLRGPWVCTRRMCDPLRSDESKIEDCKLDTVAAHFGLSRETEAHSALMDAILCGRVYARLTA